MALKKEEISLATKQKLAEALKEEMRHKTFDKIKISALLEKCNITRPTFYYHFQDIYELMYWMFENEMIERLDICMHGNIKAALERSANKK